MEIEENKGGQREKVSARDRARFFVRDKDRDKDRNGLVVKCTSGLNPLSPFVFAT